MRVLHLIKGLGPGGAEQLLVNQSRVETPGHEFATRYLVPGKDHHVAALAGAGWEVACLDGARTWDLRWAVRLRRDLMRRPIDVLHGHSPLASAVARLVVATLPKTKRPATVYTEHNEWGRHRRATRLLNRWTIRREDRVLAVSDGVRASMPAALPVTVLHHGIDPDRVREHADAGPAVRSELGIDPGAPVVGIVANLRREKAYEVLLEAAATVVSDDPDCVFVAVGQGPLEEELRVAHDRLGLGDRFRFLGYRPDAPRLMAAFDVFVLSSRHEGLPVALMEALALGIRIVATTVGGIAEATVGTDAILVAPGDPAALAAALGVAIDEVDTRPRRPVTTFDVSATVEELVAVYESVVRPS